ncbi:MAG: hypothetical protein JKY93_00475 [Gammaproteobacteria bacterium]|nr:hypothetical protein [Gammaproteobacteria bacterium]
MTKPVANNTKPISSQGTELEVSLDDGTTYVKVPELEQVPGLVFTANSVDNTPIDSLVRSNTPTDRTLDSYELIMRRVASDATQDAIIAAARSDVESAKTLPFRRTMRTGDVEDFDLELHGHGFPESAQGDSFQTAIVVGFPDAGSVVYSKVA